VNPQVSNKRTKIVATIGPASRDPAILRELLLAGVNVVRLNFSHGSHADHGAVISDVRRIADELNLHVAILQDLPGPKVRTGTLADGVPSVKLEPGQPFRLSTNGSPGTSAGVTVSYAGLPNDVEVGKRIYLADGTISLRVTAVSPAAVDTTVLVGGELRSKQGINYPEGSLSIDAVTDHDFDHLAFGLEAGVDYVAVSFVRSADDIRRVRRFMTDRKRVVPICAKIEKHEALADIEAIIEAADIVMVARGDLGIEIPLEEVPLVQKNLIRRANRASKPVITATQMLESMITNARPTRAEAADVANAILDGSDAVMLSGETARGNYPLEAVRVMATIARQVERDYPYSDMEERRRADHVNDVATAIAECAARTTNQLELDLIVTGTTTGNTARHISACRPRARIIALTPYVEVARQLALVWGCEALIVQQYRYVETLIEIAEQLLVSQGLARHGDVVAITSGMPVGEGGTNLLKLHCLS
jgi:pyruvate kinase